MSTDSRESDQSLTSLAEVTWYPLLGQSDDLAFFINESDKDSLPEEVCSALIAGGFNLLNSPYSIYKAFETAKVQGIPSSYSTLKEDDFLFLLHDDYQTFAVI